MADHVGIHIASNTLSDGSETYDVVIASMLRTDGHGVRIPAVTLKDADEFAVALRDLVMKHTVAEVTYDDPERFGIF